MKIRLSVIREDFFRARILVKPLHAVNNFAGGLVSRERDEISNQAARSSQYHPRERVDQRFNVDKEETPSDSLVCHTHPLHLRGWY